MTAPPSPASAPARGISSVDGLVQLSFLIQSALARHTAEYGLSLIQTRLLGVLHDRKPNMNELAKLLDLDKSSASGLIDRAEQRGLVKRVPSTADRRIVLVNLTRKGRSVVVQVSMRFEKEILLLLDDLPTPDRVQLSGLVSRLLVAHATSHGVDLFATIEAAGPTHS